MKTSKNLYHQVYDLENLHAALRICLRGKRDDRAALDFTYHLSEEMRQLPSAKAGGLPFQFSGCVPLAEQERRRFRLIDCNPFYQEYIPIVDLTLTTQ